MARLTARSQRRAQQRAARARATDAKKTWGKAAGRAVCEFGTRRVQLWKPRCGATRRAASLHGARQDRAARATRCGNAHGEITASCANARRESAGDGREEEGRKAASWATPRATDSTRAWGKAAGGDAGGESRELFESLARGAGSFGRRDSAQARAATLPHEQRYVGRRMARTQRLAQQRGVRPRATDAKTALPARMGTMVCELGTRHGHPWKLQRGATTWAAALDCARRERDARATQCAMAHGAITASRATMHPEASGEGRAEDMGQGGRPGNEALPAGMGKTMCECGTHRRQLLKLRRRHLCTAQDRSNTHKQREVARRTARSQSRAQKRAVRPRAHGRKTTRGKQGGRPGNEALPAESGGGGRFAMWHAAREALEAAARRSKVCGIFARRNTGARLANNAVSQGTRRDHNVVRNCAQ